MPLNIFLGKSRFIANLITVTATPHIWHQKHHLHVVTHEWGREKREEKLTFDVELSKAQLLLVVPQQEVEVLPGDLLFVIEPGRRQHGLNGLLCLALGEAAV